MPNGITYAWHPWTNGHRDPDNNHQEAVLKARWLAYRLVIRPLLKRSHIDSLTLHEHLHKFQHLTTILSRQTQRFPDHFSWLRIHQSLYVPSCLLSKTMLSSRFVKNMSTHIYTMIQWTTMVLRTHTTQYGCKYISESWNERLKCCSANATTLWEYTNLSNKTCSSPSMSREVMSMEVTSDKHLTCH